ncbi:MAG: hypothetical protein EP343_22220 [Deltaproteobacteria bacterium]|nr:MAG: hypothetical protein EP343_22220 [Deltaproteobacteria bacterium]
MRISLTSGVVLLLLCALGWGCTDFCNGDWRQCSYSVEVTDEKRGLGTVYGTSRCEPELRTSRGTSGTHTFRLALVDDNPGSKEAIDLDGLTQSPFYFSAKSLQVMQGESGPLVEVRDANTGKLLPKVTATLSVVRDEGSFVIQPNPRNLALRQGSDNRRVPLVHALLMDLSEQSALTDPKGSRFEGTGAWLAKGPFNMDSIRGDFDLFSMILLRSDELSVKDIVFYQVYEEEDKYYTGQNQYNGFIYPTHQNIDMMLEKILGLSNALASGLAPIYAGISASAKDLRAYARDGGTLLYNPILTTVLLSRDVADENPSKPDAFSQAQQRLRGSGWSDQEDTSSADFVPLGVVLYPKPKEHTREQWNQHLNKLCKAIQAGGASPSLYFGGLFELTPATEDNPYKTQMKDLLNASFHTQSKGYVETKIRYQLQGATPGQRYHVRFKLQAELLDVRNQASATPYMHFTVIP